MKTKSPQYRYVPSTEGIYALYLTEPFTEVEVMRWATPVVEWAVHSDGFYLPCVPFIGVQHLDNFDALLYPTGTVVEVEKRYLSVAEWIKDRQAALDAKTQAQIDADVQDLA